MYNVYGYGNNTVNFLNLDCNIHEILHSVSELPGCVGSAKNIFIVKV